MTQQLMTAWRQLILQGQQSAMVEGRPVLSVVSVKAPLIPTLSLFQSITAWAGERSYWAHCDEAMVAFGVTEAIESSANEVDDNRFISTERAWHRLQTQMVCCGPCSPRLLGGFAFDGQSAGAFSGTDSREMMSEISGSTPLWSHFPSGVLVLPRWLYVQMAEEAYWVLSAWISPETSLSALWAQVESEIALLPSCDPLRSMAMKSVSASFVQSFIEPQSKDVIAAWQAKVANTIEAIQQGAMHKAVLARTVVMALPHGVLVAEVLQQLAEHYPEAYLFAFERDGHCFLGASPERLVRLQQGQLETMALAGTIARGTTLSEDEVLGDQLMNSRKDQYEHQLVVNSLREALSPLCRTLTIPEAPRLHRLAQVQHLLTPVQGTLSADVGALSLVSVLHPTPAVGGLPRDIALQHIRTHEQMDRGWYAGPVGWLDSEGNAEFAVALRSGLLRDDKAYLFAGCGIVADSQPDAEYQETCLKLKTMVAALSA